MRREDPYIYPRARAIVGQHEGSYTKAGRTIADELQTGVTPQAWAFILRRTLRGEFISRRPPGEVWSLPWPYDFFRDRPCNEIEFLNILKTGRSLAATAGLEHQRPAKAFPRPEDDIPDADIVSTTMEGAVGVQMGKEHASPILEPRFPTKEVPRDFTGLIRGFERAQDEKKLHDPAQFRTHADFSHVTTPIAIFGMSDIHWGSYDVDYAAIRRHIELLKSVPNLYGICAGDVLELAKFKHRQALEDQIMPPTVQARGARAMFLEVWEKWLSLTLGNHDLRTFQDSGFDIGEFMIGEAPDGKARIPFLRDGGLVAIEVGHILYTVNVFHGDSSFGTRFNENHKGRQVARMVDGPTDIVINGHTHNPAIQDASMPSDDMQPLRDILLIQLGSYKVKGDDHARRRKFAEVNDVQMGGAILFPDVKRTIGFKRVEDGVMMLEGFTALYESGGSISRHWPEA